MNRYELTHNITTAEDSEVLGNWLLHAAEERAAAFKEDASGGQRRLVADLFYIAADALDSAADLSAGEAPLGALRQPSLLATQARENNCCNIGLHRLRVPHQQQGAHDMTTLARAQRAIDKARIPLDLVRGEGYHYFVYDDRGPNYDTLSVMIPYTKMYTAKEWVNQAGLAHIEIEKRIKRGY